MQMHSAVKHADLLSLYRTALHAVKGKRVVKRSLAERKYQQTCHLIAIGKAAESMSLGAIEQLGEAIQSGLVITKKGHFESELIADKRFKCIESDHPVPTQASLDAGRYLLNYLQQLPQNAHCLVLISGGASSLVEVLEVGWTLEELQQITHYLLENAFPIEEINAVRCHISAIKAGGLWRYLYSEHVICLMISDVADNDPAVIGSGLLFPSLPQLPINLPLYWSSRFNSPAIIKTKPFEWEVIATLDDAKQAVAVAACEMGYHAIIDPNFLQGDTVSAAKRCVQQLQQSTADIIIWGGETTVYLPDDAPVGGRNQHFALATAMLLSDSSNPYAFLCIGTDGSDGSSEVAGALIDRETVLRGQQFLLSAQTHLQHANASAFLKASGDLIMTGATGTNVMDLVIGIKYA